MYTALLSDLNFLAGRCNSNSFSEFIRGKFIPTTDLEADKARKRA